MLVSFGIIIAFSYISNKVCKERVKNKLIYFFVHQLCYYYTNLHKLSHIKQRNVGSNSSPNIKNSATSHISYTGPTLFLRGNYRLYVVVVGATIWTVRKEITVQFIPQTWNLIVKSSKQLLLLN